MLPVASNCASSYNAIITRSLLSRHMPQTAAWEREYTNPQFLTKEAEPQSDVRRFYKFLKKCGFGIEGARVLDLGAGTGRNGNYFASLGAVVSGLELSPTAVRLARERAGAENLPAEYQVGDMGKPFPYPEASFDLALDITSSNSLSEAERESYLAELVRVLRPEAYLFVKALCKEGDKNAAYLLKHNPGREKDTYINHDLDLVERVFTEHDFRALYEPHFRFIELMKKTSYTRFKGQPYRRNFWLAYLRKQ